MEQLPKKIRDDASDHVRTMLDIYGIEHTNTFEENQKRLAAFQRGEKVPMIPTDDPTTWGLDELLAEFSEDNG